MFKIKKQKFYMSEFGLLVQIIWDRFNFMKTLSLRISVNDVVE